MGKGNADPTVNSEVRIQSNATEENKGSTIGMVHELRSAGGYVVLTVSANHADENIRQSDTVDVTPVWRSPTAMRQRRALHHIWAQNTPEYQYKRDVIMGRKKDHKQ